MGTAVAFFAGMTIAGLPFVSVMAVMAAGNMKVYFRLEAFVMHATLLILVILAGYGASARSLVAAFSGAAMGSVGLACFLGQLYQGGKPGTIPDFDGFHFDFYEYPNFQDYLMPAYVPAVLLTLLPLVVIITCRLWGHHRAQYR